MTTIVLIFLAALLAGSLLALVIAWSEVDRLRGEVSFYARRALRAERAHAAARDAAARPVTP